MNCSQISLKISADDIRYARPTDLATLSGYGANSFTCWFQGKRGITHRTLTQLANALDTDVEVVIEGLRRRQHDAQVRAQVQQKLTQLIKSRS
jgi:hypothetical protein